MYTSAFKSWQMPALLLLLLYGLFVFSSQAQTSPELPEWNQLSRDQREQLMAPTRDRWDSASAEQRARMLARAERWQQMAPDERARVSGAIGRWQNLPPGQHHELRALFHHLRSLGEPEREAFLTRWKAMTAEQRRAFAEANPAPSREGPSHHRRSHTPERP